MLLARCYVTHYMGSSLLKCVSRLSSLLVFLLPARCSFMNIRLTRVEHMWLESHVNPMSPQSWTRILRWCCTRFGVHGFMRRQLHLLVPPTDTSSALKQLHHRSPIISCRPGLPAPDHQALLLPLLLPLFRSREARATLDLHTAPPHWLSTQLRLLVSY